MKHNFYETLEESEVALPSDRSTGLVLASAAVLAALVWRHQPVALAGGLTVGGALTVLSLTAPARLHQLNRAWMGLGHLMGRIVSPIVMLVLFCVAIVPFGIVMQLRRDPLRRRPASSDATYWLAPEAKVGPSDMTRQF